MITGQTKQGNKRSRTERRLRTRATVLGILLTLLVAVIYHAGGLEWLDGKLYDARAHWCQFFRKPPTDRLVHVDIDDGALETIGRWPWDRNILADIVDELGRAGTKAIAFDVLLSEVEKPSYNVSGEVTDYDALLAGAIQRMGRVLVPASMTFEKPPKETPAVRAAISELTHDLELSPEQLNKKLLASGQSSVSQDEYVRSQRKAMEARIRHELAGGLVPVDQLRARLLPQWSRDHLDENAPIVHIFNQQHLQILAERALESFSLPMPGPLPTLHAYTTIAPLPIFASAARYGGLVDDVPENDGKVRRVPAVVEFHGRLIPQMGLILACVALDVDPGNLQIDTEEVAIPLPDGSKITIPLATRSTRFGKVGMFIDIPWFGNGNWHTMYPGPQGQHLNIGIPYELAKWRRRLRANNSLIDDAVKDVLRIENDWGPPAKYESLKLNADDFSARSSALQHILTNDLSSMVESIRATPVAQRDQYVRVPDSYDALKSAVQQNQQLDRLLQQGSAQLHQLLSDHVVLIGNTASSSTDLINTPLAAQVPGVVAHGAVVNAILTHQLWKEGPAWVALFHTFILGMLATFCVAFLKHWQAAIAVGILLLGYLIFNWIYLFDLHSYLVGTAAPLSAVIVVWGAIVFISAVVEKAERDRITHHFSTYVDPQLSNYFLENPEHLHIHGQVKELTVVFTDLAGFTTITEKLGERTVDILNDYFKIMVPIIRSRRGLLNKFLGDGIMIIFGALWDNPDHAINAVDTAMEMLKATQKFSQELQALGLPPVNMRAGISTGNMIVGDAGTDTARDYTVLGDAVNTGARLEQANKRLDTQILISGGTYRHLNSDFLLRPVGALMLAGKSEPVEAYAVIAQAADATSADHRMAELSQTIIQNINAGKHTDCHQHIESLIQEFGPTKFTTAYTKLCTEIQPAKHIPA